MDIICFVCNELCISEDYFFKKVRRSTYDLLKCRSICATVLKNMGYRNADISKIIKIPRTSTYDYCKAHDSLLISDMMYRETYEKIIEKLKEYRIIE